MELATFQSERDGLAKQMESLRSDSEKKIEELKQQNAGWRNAGRQKIEELEGQLKEAEQTNDELSQKVDRLMQDGINKDKLISDLSTR